MAWPTMTDYQEALQIPAVSFSDPELKAGVPILDRLGLPRPVTGGFASVYQVASGPNTFAVRCFLHSYQDQQARYQAVAHHVASAKLPYFIQFQYLSQGIRVGGAWYPILKMPWISGDTLSAYIARNLQNPNALRSLADKFSAMVGDLERHDIAHGDLQHGNILIANDAIKLIDYDGVFVPKLRGLESHEIGHRNYQHPARSKDDFNATVDRFSAWMIYLAVLAFAADATLWQSSQSGDESLLFRQEDFQKAGNSDTLRALLAHPDRRVQAIGLQARSILALPSLSQVPRLEPATVATAVTAKPPVAAGLEWLGDYLPPEPPPSESADDGSWLSDHVDPAEPIPVPRAPTLVEVAVRAALAGDVVVVIASLLFAIPLLLTVTMVGILSLGVLLLAAASYRLQPVVREKRQAAGLVGAGERRVATSARERQKIQAWQTTIQAELTQQVADVDRRKQECVTDEETFLRGIDLGLQRSTAIILSQIQQSHTEESDEVWAALKQYQSSYIAMSLAGEPIRFAGLDGLGPGVMQRLELAGVRTAADVMNVHVIPARSGSSSGAIEIETRAHRLVHVDGVGPARAQGLLAWKRLVEERARQKAPQKLPGSEEAAIRRRHEATRDDLQRQLVAKQTAAATSKQQTRQLYGDRQKVLAEELRQAEIRYTNDLGGVAAHLADTLRESQSAEAELLQAQRRLERYRALSLPSYLAGAALGPLGRRP